VQLLFRAPLQDRQESIFVKNALGPCTDEYLNYHEEFELILVIRGSGKRFVGESVSDFGEGELALIGSNVPHLWRNDRSPSRQSPDRSDAQPEVIIVQFAPDLLEAPLMTLPEMRGIRELLAASQSGFRFQGDACATVAKKMVRMKASRPMDRLVELLQILDELAKPETQRIPLSRSPTPHRTDAQSIGRLGPAIRHIMDHFADPLSLEELAKLCRCAPETLCRQFKRHTRKSVTAFINEVRIGHARRLLRSTRAPVAQIAKACGYPSQNHFNQQFRRFVGLSPSQYRASPQQDRPL